MLLEGLPYLEETERGEEMNELNYASFEASQKLVNAGIRLETEKRWVWNGAYWDLNDDGGYPAHL